MKRNLFSSLIAVVFSLFGVFGCAGGGSNKIISEEQGIKMRMSWEQLNGEAQPKNLQQISECLESCFRYRSDFIENWKSPKKLVMTGRGDCEDFAIAGAYFAEKLGYEPKILIMVNDNNRGHATTLLESKTQSGNFYGLIERNSGEISPSFSSVKRLFDFINSQNKPRLFSKYVVIDLNLYSGWREYEGDLAEKYLSHIKYQN